MKTPLEGIKVLDLSHALAGPHCSTLLADFGADVYKLETPGFGDIARAWGSPLPGDESSYFTALHRNKRGLSIDLKSEEGKALFFELAGKVDVILENFRVGALNKLGLGYEEVRKRNPGIVYCSISGFGQDGPYTHRAAMDLIVQAESGMISITGDEGTHGARCGVSIADLTAGMYAALGIVMALRVREKSGIGQHVDISMLEGQLSLLNVLISGYLADGEMPEPLGTAYKALAPYQTFRTATRDLALAVGSQKLWDIFCPAIGRPELTRHPDYATNIGRNQNRAAMIATLQETFLTRSYEEWEKILVDAGVPVGAVNRIDQVVEHPQVKARDAIVEQEHPRAGRVPMAGVAFRLSETPGGIRSPSPSLGEHSAQVLQELLGLPASKVDELIERGIVSGPKK
ncbi:MAG: CaiB/BaiF CoA-transferase family protein [Pseudomonadota bacterium]|nr:CaiB/BaiF CoA-transferase family protein [Pseudomonadota bacterium]